MDLNASSLGDISLVLIAAAAAFIAALWLSLAIWTARDIGRRSRDLLSRILAVLLVVLLFIPGFLLYLILRPSTSLDDEYQRTLEEEALLQTIEDSAACPGCSRKIEPDWMVCPSCHTTLKKRCHNCGKLMDLPWNLCPYCAAPAQGYQDDQKATEILFHEDPESEVDAASSDEISENTKLSSENEWVFINKPDSEETQSPSNT